MRLFNLNGKPVSVNVSLYKIDWEKQVSAPQYKVKQILFPYWKHLMVLEEFRIPNSLLRIDLFNVNDKVIFEISPDKYHLKYNPFLHKNIPNFTKKIKADEQKRIWAGINRITYIELFDEDIKNFSPPYVKDKFGVNL